MRNVTLVLSVFTAGAVLGWYAHDALTPSEPAALTTAAPIAGNIIATPPARKLNSPQVDWKTRLNDALNGGDYTAALDTYEALSERSDQEALQGARAQILARASWLLAGQRHRSAQQLLESFLALSYRDVEAQTLLADAYLAEGSFRSAIEHYYLAKGYAYQIETIDGLNERIRLAVNNETTLLKQHNDQAGLLELYRYLTQLEPDYAPYFIELGKAHLALDDADAARRSLLLVTEDANVGAEAQALLASLEPSVPSEAELQPPVEPTQFSGVALRRQGHHFVVDGKLGDTESIRLMIDTGASMTIVTPDIVEQSKRFLRRTGKVGVFETANGPVRAPIYSLDSLTLGEWQVRELEVGVLALEGHAGLDGLLGMNFLRHFQFFIDQNQGVLRLAPN